MSSDADHDPMPEFLRISKMFGTLLLSLLLLNAIFTSGSAEEPVDEEKLLVARVKAEYSTIKDSLKPIGSVALRASVATAVNAEPRDGETVYNTVCLACHATGIANAPKIDDKAAWEARAANGLQALVDTAIAGKGAMPPRGGNASVTDDELKQAILYMSSKAGVEIK